MHLEIVNHIAVVVSIVISALGGAVVMWGVVEVAIRFLQMKLSRGTSDEIVRSETIRQRLGAHLLLGLEIFIAGDIISSVVSPTWDKVGILAAIVAIRTVLSYFLRMEVKQSRG
jgi:uncharacterized membrane protein